QHTESGIRDREVPKQLTGVLGLKGSAKRLTLDQDGDLAVQLDRVVHLLTLLDAMISRQLGDHLRRVEDVVPEGLDHGQDEGRFYGFLGENVITLSADACSEFVQLVY